MKEEKELHHEPNAIKLKKLSLIRKQWSTMHQTGATTGNDPFYIKKDISGESQWRAF
jgi:hypothetical protein